MEGAYGAGSGPSPALRPSAAPAVEAVAAQVAAARRDPARVLLEGVHATKHAVRFGAHLELTVTPDRAAIEALLAELAPDVRLPAGTVEVDADTWRRLVPRPLPSPLLTVARHPGTSVADVLAAAGRVVLLERPRHLGNLGAAVRVAAAADAGGVLVVGDADPWHPTAVRAAAGLGFALPVARTDAVPDTDRPLVALTPDGDEDLELPADAVLAVGTERAGLSDDLLARAAARWRLPMRPGVSSLNLATAVAAALYRADVRPAPRR